MSSRPNVTVGIDLGDRHSHLCLIDTPSGEILEESRIPTSPKRFERRFERRFSGCEPMRVAVEAGTHSPWVGRLLEADSVPRSVFRRLRLDRGPSTSKEGDRASDCSAAPDGPHHAPGQRRGP